jgi:hypothetical protein
MIGQKGRSEMNKGREPLYRHVGLGPFVFALWLVCLPISAVAAKYGGGTGTSDAPFLIYTAEDFKTIGGSPADWDKHFKLVADIDLADSNEVSLPMIGHWVALGSPANQPFQGEFDGNGKTISNFRYRDTHQDYVGLFQHVTGEIKNIKLVRATVVGNKLGTGALIGYLEKGGVLGCSAMEVNVSGNESVGGLVGCADGNVNTSCSRGSVSGVRYVGGLVGQIGGGTVAYSYSKAQVVGNESVGGLVGATIKETAAVNSCYATGDVQGTAYVGGLVGQVVAGTVFRSYSAGKVSGNQSLGGLVGYQRALAQVLGSLWDTQTSTQAKSVGGTGKTTAEMKSIDPYLAMNWDFYNTWTMCEGMNYPVLLWQIPPGDLSCPDGVDFRDFAWFAANWRHRDCGAVNSNCSGADLDRSGAVDARDLAIFAENWLAGVD